MTPAFKDYFSGHATDYRAFRPAYPRELFAVLADTAPRRELVWDCGTGNGQAAVALAEHFKKVFATDASADQVKNAEPHQRVEYAVAPAEKCPLTDHCADLVTVAQALHWFEFDKFYAEVRRVCRPGGLLAAWTYDLHSVSPTIDVVLNRLAGRLCWTVLAAGPQVGHCPIPHDTVPVPRRAGSAVRDDRRVGFASDARVHQHVVRDEGVREGEGIRSAGTARERLRCRVG